MNRTVRGRRAELARSLALLAPAFVAWRSAHALPGGGEKVELRIACEADFAAEVRRIVRLELGGLLHEGATTESGPRARLAVSCERDVARVSARDARRDQQADNDLRFDAFPGDAAPRAVALAAVEALRAVDPTISARIEAQRTAAGAEAQRTAAGDAPRAAAGVAAAPPSREPPAPTAESVASRRRNRMPRQAAQAWTRISLGPVARRFTSAPATTAWGVRAELSRHASMPLDYGVELDGTVSARRVELGTIDVRLLSAAAWIGWRTGRGDWSLTGGAGARFGVAQLQGSPSVPAVESRETSRIWTGPLAVARGDAAIGALSLAIAGEAGWAVAGAEGLSQGMPVVAARGPWLALSLNPGIRF